MLSSKQQKAALNIIAAWMGPKMGYPGSAPTGREAAYKGIGPELVPDWDWSGTPTPTILLEGGPHDWAIIASGEVCAQMDAIGVFCEPYSGWALSLYPW